MRRLLLTLLLAPTVCGGLAVLSACGGAAPRPASHAIAPPVAPLPPPLVAAGGAPVLVRADLDRILDAGLGRFLGRVDTAPVLDHGHFVGFRLTRLDPPLDTGGLRPGDVLVHVNGLPIERPEQALVAWNSLRVASALTLEIVRDGARNEVRFTIVD